MSLGRPNHHGLKRAARIILNMSNEAQVAPAKCPTMATFVNKGKKQSLKSSSNPRLKYYG